jgi:hypothetical protein
MNTGGFPLGRSVPIGVNPCPVFFPLFGPTALFNPAIDVPVFESHFRLHPGGNLNLISGPILILQ